jgi:formate dehydrogenase assembly factor FdhD
MQNAPSPPINSLLLNGTERRDLSASFPIRMALMERWGRGYFIMNSRRLSVYEQLRQEWIELHPIHSEAELASACVAMARKCGLILLNQVRGAQCNGETEKAS